MPSGGNHRLRSTRLVIAVCCAALLAACSETSLADLGSRSSEWIGERVAGAASDTERVVRYVSPADVEWVNDELGRPAPDADPASVVASVAARATAAESYVQASRYEIAIVVPGMAFVDVLPPEVVAITSQLVVAPGGERLDDEIKAAFGLWLVEPYSQSRSVGQRGTFSVLALLPEPACERLSGGAIGTCTFTELNGREMVRVDDESGQTWVWADDQYEYQLFLRGSLANNEAAAVAMINEPRPFPEVAQAPAAEPTTSEATEPDQ